ncbi:hypothetical protein ACEWY4_019728 [Coilia grayii]|uniref:Protein S100 n=1 Tax=Coilia grayii TaxID=363190 RepID=A0ABD1JCY6_9TELE
MYSTPTSLLCSTLFSLSSLTPDQRCTHCLIMSLMAAMATIIKVFKEHAGKDGDASTLSNAEVKGLLCKELGAKMETAKDKQAADKIFQGLDSNRDGKVDFTEFVIMVAALTAAMEAAV